MCRSSRTGRPRRCFIYGLTELSTLENSLNIDNIYNASASVYIIDTRTGDFILDTWHDELGNIADYGGSDRETKGDTTWDEYTDGLINLESGYVVFRTPQMDGWEYMYYAPAGINEWSIAVSVPEKEAFASVYAVQRVCLILGVLMALTIILYYLWVRHNAIQIAGILMVRCRRRHDGELRGKPHETK